MTALLDPRRSAPEPPADDLDEAIAEALAPTPSPTPVPARIAAVGRLESGQVIL